MVRENTTQTRKHRTHVMVLLPPELRRQVEQVAEAEERSMAGVCRRFVIQGLEEMNRAGTASRR